MENKGLAVLAVIALIASLVAVCMAYYAHQEHATYITTKVRTTDIYDSAVTSAKIADSTIVSADIANYTIQNYDLGATNIINDSQVNKSSLTMLNYSVAGTATASKTLVANGSQLTGHISMTEKGLTTIDYLLVMCTSNHSVITAYDKTGANTFDIYLYQDFNLTVKTEATTAEYVNWTAIGTP